jgi:hypothetical protein
VYCGPEKHAAMPTSAYSYKKSFLNDAEVEAVAEGKAEALVEAEVKAEEE